MHARTHLRTLMLLLFSCRNIQLDNAEEADSQGYNTFQESLLEYSLNDN